MDQGAGRTDTSGKADAASACPVGTWPLALPSRVDEIFAELVASIAARPPIGTAGTPDVRAARRTSEHSPTERISGAEQPNPQHVPVAPVSSSALSAVEGWSGRHPLAAHLSSQLPSAELVAQLVEVEPADADDAAVLEVVAAWERVTAWAAAQQARAVGELFRRREPQGRSRFVGDEVAARLAVTRSAGDAKVALALGLERIPAVGDALSAGALDVRKATVLTDDLLHLPEHAARSVGAAVLDDAPALTAPQLRARVRRAEIALDPGTAIVRHERARCERHVMMTPTQDAMAWVSALLPADDAMAVMTTLTAIADTAAPDDPRGIDARRADALVDLATRYLDAGVCPDGPLPTRQGRRPHLEVTASATSLLGLDERPATLAGYGPIPAPMARAIAERATWRPLLVSAETGELLARSATTYRPSAALVEDVLTRDRTCTFPGCRTSAPRCDIDHVEPFVTDRPAQDQTTSVNLAVLCRHHHAAKTHGGWQVGRDPTGVSRWRAPTGHRYARRPEPSDPPDGVPPGSEPPDGRNGLGPGKGRGPIGDAGAATPPF